MKKGDRFAHRLPRFLDEIPDMHDLLQAEDLEFSRVEDDLELLYDDAFLISVRSKVALERLERIFGILPNPAYNFSSRRNAIIAKLNSNTPSTVEAIEKVLQHLNIQSPRVEEHNEEYKFRVYVDFNSYDDFQKNGVRAVHEMKPAHLAMEVGVHAVDILPLITDFFHHHFRPKYCGELVCGEHPYESTRPIEIVDVIILGSTFTPSANRMQFAGEVQSNELSLHGYNDLNKELNTIIDQGTATNKPDTIIDGGDVHGTNH